MDRAHGWQNSGSPGSAGLLSPLLVSTGLELVLVAEVEAETDEAVTWKGEGAAAEEQGDREEADLDGAEPGPGAGVGVGAAEEAGMDAAPALVQLLGAEVGALLVLLLLLVPAALAMVVWV